MSFVSTFTAPATTSLTTAWTQGQAKALLYSVNIAAVAGADATVILNDGTTDYELLSAKTLAADARELLEWDKGIFLYSGFTLKVKSTVNNALVFVVTIEELTG